jgi:hypothetical protein
MMANPFQGDDVDPFSGVRNEEGGIKQVKEKGVTKQIGLPRTAKLSPFGLAFDTARKAGSKTFEFKGKKYTTEMAKPKPKPKAEPAKAEPAKAKVEPAKPKAEPAKTKIEKPGFFRRTIAALGGVKLPQADYGTESKDEDNEKPVARSKPVSTAGAISAANQGYKKGGNVESKLMGKEGRGMAKATMQKVASKAVKAHEGRMHKAKSGSSVSKRADGAAIRGKTRGRMV